MKCYNHHDRDAFAVCKACGKALCLECAEEYKNSFVCKDSADCRHAAEVDYRHYFIENSKGAFKFYRFMLVLLGAFLLGFVVVKSFLCCSMLPCLFGISFDTILIIILAIFLIKRGLDTKL